ncbi:MAG: mismatch repair protein MutL [Anaerocolumna sp.]|jgi:DNA mismatch repair protein MutL|nr:mismatch repair protein MutL [Anaerocolumna sp.]
MSKITVLDQNTINQIAAGEVIERPAAVVKELVENAIDAGANAVTVEIKEGGISFIRITDNGSGIDEDDMPLVFLRHSTSKIKTAEDLLSVSSLGFRGEALSSIAAVSQVELVTKTNEAFTGIRYQISGGEEKGLEHIGCPNGTTFIIRNLFFNTPARKKFLKSAVTEAGYISDLMERLAVSHPNISFKFINNGQIKLHTSGNNNLKDIIYNVYGREVASQLEAVEGSNERASVIGFIAKPIVSRGNRNYENYFINGRYIKSHMINKAIEEAYRPYIMAHRYPFTSLHIRIDSELIDVNVHPAKLEIRFKNSEELYQLIYQSIKRAIEGKELIPNVSLTEEKEVTQTISKAPEPFEQNRRKEESSSKPLGSSNYNNDSEYHSNRSFNNSQNRSYGTSNDFRNKYNSNYTTNVESNRQVEISSESKELIKETEIGKLQDVITSAASLVKESVQSYGDYVEEIIDDIFHTPDKDKEKEQAKEQEKEQVEKPEQLSFISEEAIKSHRIIGQVFSTYWIVEFGDKMFMIDQHAAHEKVLYEKIMKTLREKHFNSQIINPPIILTLSIREEEALKTHMDDLSQLGFEIEEFGGKEYAVRSIPNDLYGLAQSEILIELIDGLVDEIYNDTPEMILEKIASMSCKAAVKGNQRLSYEEAQALIEQLLTLENPYHCPHGRPTIVSMSKYEIEKKFKRIV